MTDTPRMLDREFRSLVKACDIEDAPDNQLRECRRFFFAGARSYSHLVMTLADDRDEATDADMALMEALEAEMDAFLVDMQEGRA